jgi:uncharacterized protein YdeI (YjbR/CyaY-like superfamily)
MSTSEKYIGESPEFARPVFSLIVKLVRQVCPPATEAIKWGFPHFMYKGKILCSFAAFSKHCAISIPMAKYMDDKTLQKIAENDTSMGHFGKITSVKDLPAKGKMIDYLKSAIMIIDNNSMPANQSNRIKNKVQILPNALQEALQDNPELNIKFGKMPPSHQNEYIKYINEAKKQTTMLNRVTKVMEMLQKK